MILIARQVTHPAQASLGFLDIHVERNGYGRQLDSRVAKIDLGGESIEAVFIRAPVIRHIGPGVRALASYQGTPVWVEDGLHMATTFHPELAGVSLLHHRFLGKL
jgi:5'-phosphate synthase pdxT subunit